MTKPVFCTSICANYLGKALALADSLKRHMPESEFVIALVERDLPDGFSRPAAVDRVILARDFIAPGAFDSWIFRYSIVEASTAVKAQLFRQLYREYPDALHFIYLDPDTFVYSAFPELFQELAKSPIVLTPHLLFPGNLDMELSSLKHGVFNLGFLAIRRSAEAERFLEWWSDRLDYACYDDIPNGIFTDQKWINLVPCFFESHILRHPGYNFATWTLMTRKLTRTSNGTYYAAGEQLRFVHFSGFDSGMFHRCIKNWAPDNSQLLNQLAGDYQAACDACGAAGYRKIAWSYANFESGRPVSRLARLCWREVANADGRNPFCLSNSALYRILSRREHALHLAKKFIRPHL